MTPADGPAPPEPALRIPDWLQVVLLAALWLVTHPYRGIIHDGRLYTVQALNQLDPATFAQDLFFKYGSQDSFTIFSALYKPLVALAGPPLAHALATGIGQALWFAALLLLMRTLFGRGAAFLLAAAGCICLESYYGGISIFRYGETFATPRLFAEALVMAAMAGALTRRFAVAALILLLAAAIHPIMALTGIGFLAILIAQHDRRAWLLIAAGAAGGLLLAALGVPPFARVLAQFDAEWLEIVKQRCSFAFLAWWMWPDFLRLASTAAILAAAWLRAAPAERPPVVAAALAALASLAVTGLGADLGHNILVVNAQPWRMLWLATLLANAWLALLAWRTPRAWTARELLIAACLLSALASFLPIVRVAASVAAIAAAAVLMVEHLRRAPAPALVRIPARVALVLSLVFTGFALYRELTTPEFDQTLIRLALFATLLGCGFRLVFRATPPRRPLTVLVAILAAAAAVTVDQRAAWTRFVEAPAPAPALDAFLGGAREVYWEDGVDLQWFKLRRTSYYSCTQGTGAMFFRGTAIEYRRRTQALQPLNSEDFRQDDRQLCAAKPAPKLHGTRSPAPLAAACRSLPELDAIVLFNPVPGATAAAVWRAPAPRIIEDKAVVEPQRRFRSITRYYRYACADLRGAEPRT